MSVRDSWLVEFFCVPVSNLCAKKRKKENRQPKGGMGGHHTCVLKKERMKTDNPREGWEDGTPPPHRDFKERSVTHLCAVRESSAR